MNLKEAFRYQNKLQSLLDEAQGILDCDANVTKVANTYLRHKVMPEAEDETVMDVAQTEYAEQITDIARFMLYLLEEKSRLFAAIRKAKDALDMDMDSEVSLNAARQSIARTFKRMNDLRSSEQLLSGGGTGYRFNAEGNQISSDELAQFLAQRAGSGAGDVAFVIGSAHGLSDEVKKVAALKFSMGRITMPHQLARLVLTEQIYRACTINAGMKYHK